MDTNSITCRAKFYVQSVTKHSYGGVEISMQPVMSGSKENESFWASTPNGQIKFSVSNPKLLDAFEPNQEYYIDFTKAI